MKEVSKVKGKHKEVHTWGSGDLVRQLLELNLVDRLDLWVYPVLLGKGKRLFDGGSVPATLKLIESKSYPKGAVHLVYEPAGKPTFGTMGAQ